MRRNGHSRISFIATVHVQFTVLRYTRTLDPREQNSIFAHNEIGLIVPKNQKIYNQHSDDKTVYCRTIDIYTDAICFAMQPSCLRPWA